MKKYSQRIAIGVLMIFVLSGCGKSSKTKDDATSESEKLTQITMEQFEADSMKIGETSMHNFEEEVICNGYITAPANGIAQISTPVSGIVESIRFTMGSYVKKGEILCMLSSNELMVIQQEFAECSALLKRLQSDYERSKALFNEKIGAEKDFIASESDYKAMKSNYQSLKLRLELLRLNVSKIENGELYATFPVISPISGYITRQQLVLGQFMEQQKFLLEIVDVNNLQLELSVFGKDIDKLKLGQTVNFSTMGETASSKHATLTSIGKAFNSENNSVTCIAIIQDKNQVNLINQSYITASIVVKSSESNSLPTETIIKSGKDYYIFVVEKFENKMYYLQKKQVTIGRASKGYTEIINGNNLTKILIKGAYNLSVE